MTLLLLLAACADDGADSAAPATGCAAAGNPELTLVSPEYDSTWTVGESVPFEADIEATGMPLVTWAVDGDAFATGAAVTWIAEGSGDRVVQVSVQDDCGSADATALIRVNE